MKPKNIIICVVIALVLIASVIVINILNFNKNDIEVEEYGNNKQIEQNETTDNETNTSNKTLEDYGLYTAETPKDERDLCYYWNINTDGFDKSLFDGRISVFGTIISDKLTGKTMKENGFTLNSSIQRLKYDEDEECYIPIGNAIGVTKDEIKYPKYGSLIYKNYSGIDDPYDDTTEIYFYNNTIYKDVENVIIPYMQNADYNNITLDDIMDNLGVPTYVVGRDSDLEDSDSLTYIQYLYVYDEYAFEFMFAYQENDELSFLRIEYMGEQTLAKEYEVTEGFDDNYELIKVTYDSYLDYCESKQEEYLQSLEK